MLSTMHKLALWVGIYGLTGGSVALSQSTRPALPDAPPPPVAEKPTEPVPLPPKEKPHDQAVPVISITTDEKGQIVEEYKINDVTYMMRVTPKKGVPYYLIDVDGDGDLETSQFPDNFGPQPVFWKLLEW